MPPLPARAAPARALSHLRYAPPSLASLTLSCTWRLCPHVASVAHPPHWSSMFCSLWPRRSVARALPASLSRAFFLRLTPRPPTRLSCAGELVCFASECCCIGGGAAGDKFFECFHHADQCHAGTGTYVILKSSMVLVPRTRFCPVSLPAPPVEPPCILLIPSKLLYLKLGVDADDACSTYLG